MELWVKIVFLFKHLYYLVLNVLINVIQNVEGLSYYENKLLNASSGSSENIANFVIRCYFAGQSDLTLEKCLLFFINLTMHKYPNLLAVQNWASVRKILVIQQNYTDTLL